MNGIANVQLRNVHCDPVGQVAGKTFNCQRTQALLQQSAEGLRANGRAERFQRHLSLNQLIHGDGVKVDVTNLATDRRVLHFLHKRRAALAVAANFELDQDVFS